MRQTIVLFASLVCIISGIAPGTRAVTLTASISNNAPAQVMAGQNFNFTIHYTWNGYPNVNPLTLKLSFPSTWLDLVSASMGISGPDGSGQITCYLARPQGVTGISGSGNVILTVHFKANLTDAIACLSGSISDGTTGASTNQTCVSVSDCHCKGIIFLDSKLSGANNTILMNLAILPGGLACGDPGVGIDCKNRVAARVNQLTAAERHQISDAACALGIPSGTAINAVSRFGNLQSVRVQTVGILTNNEAETTCHCPAGWISNTSGVAGDETTDGKCKKKVGTMSISPVPPNTQLSTWGFTVGGDIYVWGTPANGGATVCATTAPKQCIIQ